MVERWAGWTAAMLAARKVASSAEQMAARRVAESAARTAAPKGVHLAVRSDLHWAENLADWSVPGSVECWVERSAAPMAVSTAASWAVHSAA